EVRFGLREVADAAGGDDRRVEACGAHVLADPRGERNVARERAARVGVDRRHALVTGAPGVRVDGPADLRLLRVLELAALRDRQEVETGARELDAEPRRVVD